MRVKTIDLFNKPFISLLTIEQPVQMPTPMPEDQAAFAYIIEGRCMNFSEIDSLDIKKGDAVLAKCGNSHFKTVEVNGNPVYQAITIKFHKEILETVYADSQIPFYKQNSKKLLANSVLVKMRDPIKQLMNSFLYYFDHEDELTYDLLTLKMKELILLLLQTDQSDHVLGIMSNLFERHTFQFKEVIKSHICSPISMQELAQLTNHSLSSFKKEFKRIYNDTPNNYIIGKRIEKVAELLPQTDDTLSNIAYQCEFKTLAHMSRVFKEKYGISPSQYRLNLSDKQ